MKSLIIAFFVIFSFSGCKSQKRNNSNFNNDNINFKYSRLYYKDSVVVESDMYNSYTGLYQYKEYNFGFGEDKNISTTIKLSEKELQNIYQLYLLLNPKYLSECTYMDGKLLYKSTIAFNVNAAKDETLKSSECSNDKKENEKYSKIETLVYDLIIKSPEYRKAFYWEFIKK
ncbi:hypothetical protein EG346_04245 [Chryseobacterium carnipullorum]|uniref:Lipoprotein n=1 Tax=Chryseobacterium carnipullorum TaxID=1124835 RepID=A0A376EIV7_CHRCU|nr:hypothetical protein [Chryseobacterium carnipullorum]AZA47440.1 hypothetical protein EG346_04245 [Chryseobacterium carnipullorum]AZA66778.1 hypothetical protein EG345_20365 [Chryseobacterium carnipullorum]STD09976.1 Uncharacterised protein [Chryseobacterium carnipullorum]